MPRFVLLRHECPPDEAKPSHWDFMLEANGTLRTWDLRQLPTAWVEVLEINDNNRDATHRRNTNAAKTVAVNAFPLPDHRLAYLDYQGPLTNNRGDVTQCDTGTYLLQRDQPELLTISLSGTLLHGEVQLTKHSQAWTLKLVSEAS